MTSFSFVLQGLPQYFMLELQDTIGFIFFSFQNSITQNLMSINSRPVDLQILPPCPKKSSCSCKQQHILFYRHRGFILWFQSCTLITRFGAKRLKSCKNFRSKTKRWKSKKRKEINDLRVHPQRHRKLSFLANKQRKENKVIYDDEQNKTDNPRPDADKEKLFGAMVTSTAFHHLNWSHLHEAAAKCRSIKMSEEQKAEQILCVCNDEQSFIPIYWADIIPGKILHNISVAKLLVSGKLRVKVTPVNVDSA